MRSRELGVAVGAEDEQTGRRSVGHDVAQQLEARLVDPVQVVEHEEHGTLDACQFEEAHRGGIEEVALGVGVGALGCGEIPQALLEGGHQAGELAPMGGDVRTEQRLLSVGHVVGERFVEGSVGCTHLFVAAPEKDGQPVLVGPPGDLRDEGGLALAGFPGDEDDLASLARGTRLAAAERRRAPPRGRPPPRRDGEPGGPEEECRPTRSSSSVRGSQPTDERLDGLGQALELELAERGKGVGASAPGAGPHQVGNQDLA
jgi:hypothetical protein